MPCSLTWETFGVKITASRFQQERGGVTAECVVEKQKGEEWKRFTSYRLSMTSISQRRDFIRELSRLWTGPDWDTITHQLCDKMLAAWRSADTATPTTGDTLLEQSTFLLNPLLYAGHVTLLYGPGDSGKSVLSALAALLLVHGGSVAGLAAGGGFHPLLLDWERTFQTFDSRLSAVANGHADLATAKTGVWYQRMHRPLADSVEDLNSTIEAHEIDVLLVDSLGMASGGDLNASESATRFFDALRSFDLPALVIGHTHKAGEDKTIFGSVFFYNLASMVWEVAAEHEEESQTLKLGLFCRKNNVGPRQKPLGLAMTFTEDRCTILEANLAESPTLTKKFSRAEQIRRLLSDHQGRTSHQIADDLADDEHAIRTELNRYKGKYWHKVDDRWVKL